MKDKILNYLKQGKKPQSEIASILGINYYKLLRILEEMEKKDKSIKKEINEKGTYIERIIK